MATFLPTHYTLLFTLLKGSDAINNTKKFYYQKVTFYHLKASHHVIMYILWLSKFLKLTSVIHTLILHISNELGKA